MGALWKSWGESVTSEEIQRVTAELEEAGYFQEEKKKEEGKTWLVWVGLALLASQSS